MGKHFLILPEGTRIASGTPGESAILSVTVTACVNDGVDISPGSACAAMAEITLLCRGENPITAGVELQLWEEPDTLLGRFLCETPERTGQNTYRITAYDAMTRFDRDISPWLASLQGWPYTLQGLLEELAAYVGVPLAEAADLPGGDFPVGAFSGRGITGRALLRWIGQLSGRFFRVKADGALAAQWYWDGGSRIDGLPRPVRLRDGLLVTAGRRLYTAAEGIPYLSGSMTYPDYATAPIGRVQIRSGEQDVGAVWPDGSQEAENTCVLSGNPLLSAASPEQLQAAAKRLYEQLRDLSYTPLRCKLLPGFRLEPGQIVTFTDRDGNDRRGLVMTATCTDGTCTLEATGNPSLHSTTAFNSLSLQALSGRVLEVERTAEGLRVAHADTAGRTASLELDVDGLRTRVSAVESGTGDYATQTQVSTLEQRADGLDLSVTTLREEVGEKADQSQVTEVTEHFHFGAEGMTISNSATGMGIHVSEEQVAFTGGIDPTTVITPNAMQTTDLTVGTRLNMGAFSWIPRTNGNLSLRYTGG